MRLNKITISLQPITKHKIMTDFNFNEKEYSESGHRIIRLKGFNK